MRYKEYKKVDLPWLDELPSHWDIKNVNSLFNIRRGVVIPKTELVENGKYPVYSSQTKNHGILGYLNNYDIEGYSITWTTDGANAGTVFFREGKYNCTNICGILESREKISRYQYIYYAYVLKETCIHHKRKDTNGYKIMSNEMKRIELPSASKEEQEQIARFLDWKISEIDRLIELEKQKIKKLEINFTIIINNIFNAVEGEKVKLKYIFDFGKGLNVTKDDLSENGIKCISYGEIHGENRFSFSSDDKNLKSLGSHVKLNTFANLNQGDFVFCDTSEDLEGSGNFSYKKDSGIVYASYHTIVAKPKVNFNSEYIAYFFESDLWRAQIRANVKGIKVYSITQFILKDSYIILPDIYTQKKIVKNLNHFNGKKINLVNNISAAIKNLESLKQSLISDVVTGRIDVRDIEIPNYDKVYDIEDDAMLVENFNEEV